jgi:DNA polymerase III subunit delta'
MNNWNILGHDWAVDFLRTSLRHGRARHAYLITGSHNIGKSTLAHAFASALNCTQDDPEQRPCGQCRSCRLVRSGNHPDLLYTVNDEKTGALKIESVREVMSMIALKPFDSRYRVAILHDFDRAAPRTQDALLKTLEEPPKHAVILVMAQGLETILPTIKSRCQWLPLRPVPSETVKNILLEKGAPDDQAILIARLSGGRIGWALEALNNPIVLEERTDALNLLSEALRGGVIVRFNVVGQLEDALKKDRDGLRYLLEMWQSYWRDVLLLANESPVKPCNTDRLVDIQQIVQRIQPEEALKALQATRTMLYETLNTNANTRLALETMMLQYP